MQAPTNQLSLFEEARPSHPARVGPASIALRSRSRILTPGAGAAAGFDFTLNPYVGCGFGCSYCFAANFVADEQKKASWGDWVEVKFDSLRELSRADLKGKKIFMSSATDPYQPLEARLEFTRSIVKLLSEPIRQPHLIVQTRSPLVVRDADLFAQFENVRVQMSITTDDEDVRKLFEPRCASIDRRFEALEQVASAGIPIGVSISPTLPIKDPHAFAKRIAALNPEKVWCQGFLRSDRPFAADTRVEGLKIAALMGWTDQAREEAIRGIRKHLAHVMS